MNERLSTTTALLSPVLPAEAAPAGEVSRHAASRDRVLFTLLALDLMLMAFFVVLNASATFDRTRGAAVARTFQPRAVPSDAAPVAADDDPVRAGDVAMLRAAVAEVFAPFIAAGGVMTNADDRVEVDVAATVVDGGDQLPALLDGLAHIMADPTGSLHTQLIVRMQAPTGDPLMHARVAGLANAIVARGVQPTALAIGTIAGAAGEPARLRFTFFVLAANASAVARVAAPAPTEHP
jgi:hypothetical protein